MKSLSLLMSLLLLSSLTAEEKPVKNQKLNVTTPKFSKELKSNRRSWTMVIIPDTQSYVKYKRNHEAYLTMMNWVYEKRKELNISMVLHVGDLVEHNDRKDVPKYADQTSAQQWEVFKKGIDKLEKEVPVIVCAGNHDMGPNNAENRHSYIKDYVNPKDSKFLRPISKGGLMYSAWKDPLNGQTVQNAFYKWKSPNGQKFHILSMEFNPRRRAMIWGMQQLKKTAKDSIGIYLTHSYLNSMDRGSLPLGTENYGIKGDSTNGITTWEKIVKNGNKIDMTFSGHIATSEGHTGQIAFRQDYNADKKVVSQMMFNAQRYGGWNGNGGNGWLRLLEFLPDNKTVIVRTFSPYLEKFPEKGEAHRQAAYDHFQFEITK